MVLRFQCTFFLTKLAGVEECLFFLCQHKYSGLFELNEEEWNSAIECYPELNEPGSCFECDNRSANASMESGKNKNVYFDNKAILEQFERLFKMLKFKKNLKITRLFF